MPIEMMIRKLRLHSELPDENIEVLRSIVTPAKNMSEDSVIVREGELSTQCCVIMSGFAYRSKVPETGKRQILSFHIAGDMSDLQRLCLTVAKGSQFGHVRSTPNADFRVVVSDVANGSKSAVHAACRPLPVYISRHSDALRARRQWETSRKLGATGTSALRGKRYKS
ncbi:Crp/Fnr family transcriptional regulator [Bradyrhizobium sp. Arg62]|uniref:hypothetical protein n=1 Tax=Bradyrhizobium brasilense TaxID=1419277 RepID=UPI001E331BC9|nr:hypothetical protein [Bradyrhizobium brasilense]MCC8946561.1 Crp/Fnr family transcriptional regulator [Bradyrhizobium brasilense]